MARPPPPRFAFGKNWESFVSSCISPERVALAQESLRQFLGASFAGRRFLDIGCGSGLFSLAASLLGASVESFDHDPDAVRASRRLRDSRGIPEESWKIEEGSVLDHGFLAKVEPADLVYSWGVLHHTGDMWRALDNAAAKVRPGGLLEISIYNKVERRGVGSRFWLKVKRTYVRSPWPVKTLIEQAFVLNFFARHLATLRNPWRAVRDYGHQRSRGMDFWHDVRDWVGGYPYEFATAGEVFNYLHSRHGLELRNLVTTHSLGCNQFVFRRPAAGVPRPAAGGPEDP